MIVSSFSECTVTWTDKRDIVGDVKFGHVYLTLGPMV
jgi:hypothetical protein